MTKRLILMRHAKSDWSHDLDDHERPLNARGQRSAKALRSWLGLNDYRPDQVLCSTAERTRETLFHLDFAPEIISYHREMYLADSATLLSVLKGARGECVLMIAHNPGIAWFAAQIVAVAPEHARFDDYPTGATTVIDFEITDWQDLSIGTGKPVDFAIPRELTDG